MGYVYLYERAYGPEMTLARLEQWWSRKTSAPGSAISERLFIAARTAGLGLSSDPDTRRLYREGTKMLLDRSMRSEIGQLLYMFDANHFARFLRRFNSINRDRNYALFDDPDAGILVSKRLNMQWDKVQKKRAARGLAVVTG
jgi:hypothetical protein